MMGAVAAVAAALGLMGLLWVVRERGRRQIHSVEGGIDRSVLLPHTRDVELYSNSFSHCSRKTRLVLEELGIQVRHHPIDLIETGSYQTISPEYLKINPSGLVPTLVHRGHPVFESDDILKYAQSIAGPDAPRLTPEDPKLRDQMQHWLDFCAISSSDAMGEMTSRAGACIPGLSLPMFAASIAHVPLRRILIGFLFHFDKKRPVLFTLSKLMGLRGVMRLKPLRELMHTSRDHMRQHLRVLNSALASHDQPWILGEAYSLADISLACVLLRLDETGWLAWFEQVEDIPEVTQYYSRLMSRPAWSEAIDAHDHLIVAKARTELADAVGSDKKLKQRIYGASDDTPLRAKEQSAW